jgi:hypothetical protein
MISVAIKRAAPRAAPFDLTDPPSEPPQACLDRQRWRLAREMFTRHEAKPDDPDCNCGEPWPCPERRRAIRGLLTACLQLGPIKVNRPLGMASPHTCRWCERDVVAAPVYGWVHVGSGLLVCERQQDGEPGVWAAEPAE